MRIIALLISLLFLQIAVAQLHDPTQPTGINTPAVAGILGKDLTVSAVFSSQERYVAIINGTLVKQGDIINGYRIMNIQPYGVKFKGPEGIFVKGVVFPRVKYPVQQRKLK